MSPIRPALAVSLALAMSVCLARCTATAQPPDELLVARVCLSEAPRDCTAIAHVLSERASARGLTVREAACGYAPRSCGRREYTARPWVPLAHPDRAAPAGWPGRSSWERTRTLLGALTVVAWRGLRGIDATPCPGATKWAARTCARCASRMRAAGFERIECPSANAFWRAGDES